jgi:CheY-like chemotaxis protein
MAADSSAQEHLRIAQQAILRAADLCKQMLDYSGRGRFSVKTCSLNRIVEETSTLLHLSIGKKVELRLSLDPRLSPIEGDATQLRQVIMNLVINASEAIGDTPGVITLATRMTRIAGPAETPPDAASRGQELPAGAYVCMEVSDTGGGMTPAVQARIFDPFFTTKFTGRGLGLAAVDGIVRGHKGALTVHSEVGVGTTFRLFLPGVAAAETPVAEPLRPDPNWKGEGCLLLVDDEPMMRTTTARLLRACGFEVVTAEDGREGLERFLAEPDRFRLVLMDLTMPKLGGEQAFQEMQRIREGVRVVLMSGYDPEEISLRFKGRKPVGYLMKPFDKGALLGAIRRALAGA